MTENDRYQELLRKQAEDWEAFCENCGACCGAVDGDPCKFLNQKDDGSYFCSIYNNRFGEHYTRSGRIFRCVPIRKILNKSWPGDARCAYKKKFYKY